MKRLLFLISVVAVMLSCQPNRQFFPSNLPRAEVQLVRFDSALISVDSLREPVLSTVHRLFEEYPDFMPFFAENIMGIPASDTMAIAHQLPLFLGDTLYGFRQTNECVEKQFAKTDDIEEQLTEAFSRLLWLYPEAAVPQITCFVSGFNASLFFWETPFDVILPESPLRVAVGLDMYLGSDYELYDRVVWNYQKQTMRRECIAGDVVSACLFRMLPFTSDKSRLLENMLYRGKIMYLLSLLMPQEKNYDVMGYTKEQWQWLERNERAVWQLMMDRHDIFKTESTLLTSYLDDGPFTAEISQEAPPRLGTWIGWRIAESYMNHNPQVTLQELMAEGDAQKILEESYYRP